VTSRGVVIISDFPGAEGATLLAGVSGEPTGEDGIGSRQVIVVPDDGEIAGARDAPRYGGTSPVIGEVPGGDGHRPGGSGGLLDFGDDFAGLEPPDVELEPIETFGAPVPRLAAGATSDWFRLFVEEQMARITQMRQETEEVMRAGTRDIIRQRAELQAAIGQHRETVAAHRQEMQQFSEKATAIRENLLSGLRAQMQQSREECEKFRSGWREMSARCEEHARAAKATQESLTERVNALNAGRATVQQRVEDFVQWTADQKRQLEERAEQIGAALEKLEADASPVHV
jgi:hypothetical protein